jgi:hypothetical protein
MPGLGCRDKGSRKGERVVSLGVAATAMMPDLATLSLWLTVICSPHVSVRSATKSLVRGVACYCVVAWLDSTGLSLPVLASILYDFIYRGSAKGKNMSGRSE